MSEPLLCRETLNSQQFDERLCTTIGRAMQQTGYLPLRSVQVVAHEGFVSLKGRVPTYYLKQVAQSTAMSIDGVDALENDITVA